LFVCSIRIFRTALIVVRFLVIGRLSPCGHVLCESCLKSWFTSPQPGAPVLLAPQHRQKTCPCCRTTIRTRPIAIYLVKSVVSSLAPSLDPSTFSRPSLVDGPKPAAGDLNNDPSQDPWVGIFPAPRGIHALADHPGLIIDEQDGGVLRCAECLHEIFDGLCTGCGRTYDDAVAEAASDIEAFRLYPFGSDSDDEDHESAVSFAEAYEDSFIDDGEEDDEGGDPRSAADESAHGEIDIDEAAGHEAFFDAHNGNSSDRSSLPRVIFRRQTRRVAGPQDSIESEEVFHDARSTILDDEQGGASRATPVEAQQSRAHGQVSSGHLRAARPPRVSSPVIILDPDSSDEGAFYERHPNILRVPMPRMHLDELGRVVFDSTDDEADLSRDRNSLRRRLGLSSSRRTDFPRRARVIRSISPSVNGSESEEYVMILLPFVAQ
jgi:Zinc finger, C3HC4 type (RING finger)